MRFKVGDRLIFKSTGSKYEVIEISHRGYELLILRDGSRGWDPEECEHNYILDEDAIVDRILTKYNAVSVPMNEQRE